MKHNKLYHIIRDEMETTRKLLIILMVIAVGSLTAYSSDGVKKTLHSDSGAKLYKNIEFASQDAILRGRLYLPENKSKKSP